MKTYLDKKTRIALPKRPPMEVAPDDREILRRLAGQVGELAKRDIEKEKIQLWKDINTLKSQRPLVFCSPENSWHEIIPADTLECKGQLARLWEFWLRQEIFWGTQMGDDRVVTGQFNVVYSVRDTGYGVEVVYHHGGEGGSFVWDAPITDWDRLADLKFPTLEIDWDATWEHFALAQSIFEGLLQVRIWHPWAGSVGLTRELVRLRGLEQSMIDMALQPEGFHALMKFLSDATTHRLDFLEHEGVLCLNNGGDYVGSGGFGWTDELPQEGFNGRVRLKDMWGIAESQETVGISPKMFEEFVFPYQKPLVERFGLSCYGCCEALHNRWHIVKQISNLRRVSISPWCEIEPMAEDIQDKYIMSIKPNPEALATSSFDEDYIRADIRTKLQQAKGCQIELIMKDNHTINSKPERVIRWCQIAREEAEAAVC